MQLSVFGFSGPSVSPGCYNKCYLRTNAGMLPLISGWCVEVGGAGWMILRLGMELPRVIGQSDV